MYVYACSHQSYAVADVCHKYVTTSGHEEHKNCDWSALAAYVFSHSFLTLVESEENMLQEKKKGSVIFIFSLTRI